jgi:hypothetical protein
MQTKEEVDLLDSEFVRNTAVRLCMLGCGDGLCCGIGTCDPRAVQLYDDAEVRDTIFRAFGEVSRSQFNALCAEGYRHRTRLVREAMYTQAIGSFASDAQVALRIFEYYPGLSNVLPWQYWAASNAALLLEKSKRFTHDDRITDPVLEMFDLDTEEGHQLLNDWLHRKKLNSS